MVFNIHSYVEGIRQICTCRDVTNLFKVFTTLQSKTGSLKLDSPSRFWRAKFQLHICNSDWLTCIHFSGYNYKIRLVLILRKIEDQAIISISTILKFPALIRYFLKNKLLIYAATRN